MTTYTSLRQTLREKLDNDPDKLAATTHFIQSIGTDYEGFYSRGRQYLEQIMPISTTNPIEWDIPFPPTPNPTFTFIDLFAGIGGFRIAFQRLGGKCVFSSEWDKHSQITYDANFGEVPFGDITKIGVSDIPNHDVLLGGFPCQAFSIAGHQGGFDDTRGTMFFEIARILREKRPKAFFLENVKNLVHHRSGKTFKRILEVLREDLGYYVPEPKIINAKDFGVPQNRERVFIIGFRDKNAADCFEYPRPLSHKTVFSDIKEEKPVSVRYYISEKYLTGLRKHKARHEAKGHGFGFEIIPDDSIANAIVLGGMGRERNLVIDHRLTDFTPVTSIQSRVNREGIRRMTPREWARLQGFPDNFIIDAVSITHSYRQIANAVAVPAIEATAKMLIGQL